MYSLSDDCIRLHSRNPLERKVVGGTLTTLALSVTSCKTVS